MIKPNNQNDRSRKSDWRVNGHEKLDQKDRADEKKSDQKLIGKGKNGR